MFRHLLFATACVFFASAVTICNKDLVSTIQWTGGHFAWPNEATRKIYTSAGKYSKKAMIATRGQIYGDDAIVCIPRYRSGIPATLAKVSLLKSGCEATLDAFPCWVSQEEGNCKALQSAVDVFLDSQNVLWVLDVGVVNTLETPVRRCPPKVVAFSMKTGKQLKTLDLSGLVAQASRPQYVVVEYTQDGRPFVYVSDAATRSILVFDVAGDKGYRFILPKAVTTGMGRRDVLYIALARKGCGNNFLVFTYLSSSHMFSIRTDYLRTGSTSGRVQDLGPKPQKLVIVGTDLGSALFLRYEGKQDVYRWDTNNAFKKENFVAVYKSPDCLLTTQAMPDVKRQRIRVLESNFHDYIQNTVGCGAHQQISMMSGSCT